MKRLFFTDYSNNNIQTPTKEEYIIKLISKGNSTQIIMTKIHQFQLRKSTNYKQHGKFTQ